MVCHICSTPRSIQSQKILEENSSRGKKLDFFGDSNFFPQPFFAGATQRAVCLVCIEISLPQIGRKKECYIVKEAVEEDELKWVKVYPAAVT